jgi:hypothetical protein
MQDRKSQYTVRTVLIEIGAFTKFLLRRWWLFLILVCVGAGIGVVVHSFQKPKYDALCTFILEEKSAGAGGLAGLASQFGFDMGGMAGGGGIFAGDNILEILKSKKIVYKVLLSNIDDSSMNSHTLADLFLDFSGWKKKWVTNATLKDIQFNQVGVNADLLQIQDSVLNRIHEFMLKKSLSTERLNKKGSIIKVKVTSFNSLFARLFTERLVDEATKLYLNIKTGTAQANIAQMQRRSDSLLYTLNRRSYSVAASQPLDINPGIKVAAVPLEIATRDKTVLATLYAEVTKNLEANKLLLSQQTPVIQILDRPGMVLEDSQTSLTLLIIAFSFGFVVIGLVYCFLLYYLSHPIG